MKAKIEITVYEQFPKRSVLDSSKLKNFADNNFKFYKNGRKFPNG